MDELKPVGLLYAKSGFGWELRAHPAPELISHSYTETPLYGPEALIAIARAMQERCGERVATLFFCQGSSGNMAHGLTQERAGEAILSLDTEALVREYMEKK